MIISVVNHTSGLLSDAEVQHAVRAVNRQINEDFAPHWGMNATLRLEGHSVPADQRPPASALQQNVDLRGDGIIYIWHPLDTRSALGYHAVNSLGIPYGYVFPALSQAAGEPWSVTLSHEALEMVADPDVNLLVMGPHPANSHMAVFHWHEVCDAVQVEHYRIDGVTVSNFLLPLYFTSGDELNGRNDFLGTRYNSRTIKSFGVNPGSYVGFFNPATSAHEIYYSQGDIISQRRLALKGASGLTRRALRYKAMTEQTQSHSKTLRKWLHGE